MRRQIGISVAIAVLIAACGCATKRYVHDQASPLIERVNQLDSVLAGQNKSIQDLEASTQKALQNANSQAEMANQQGISALQQANEAQKMADAASHQVTALAGYVSAFQDYQQTTEAAVLFESNRANLTEEAKRTLDGIVAKLHGVPNYVVTVKGRTDARGGKQHNYKLSERRAESVEQYLVSEHNIPAFKIYSMGLGEDTRTVSTETVSERAGNRRVEVNIWSSAHPKPVEGAVPANVSRE